MDQPVSPTPGRRRVAVACDLCRRRKMKCDGARPTCTYCGKRRLHCVYQQPQQRVQVTQAYLTRLLSCVDELQRGSGSSQDRPERVDIDTASPESVSMSAPMSVLPSPDSTAGATAVSVDTLPDCPVDAMACVGPPPEATNTSTSSSYYGNSSTLSFLRTLQTTVFRTTSAPSAHTPATIVSGALTKAPPAPPISSRFLPPRSTADYLIDVYFSHVSDLYTVLHEASFRREYARLWQPGVEASPDTLWLCIMNCVLALACVFSDGNANAHGHGVDDGRQMAQTLYGQARTLCPLDQLDDDTFVRSGSGSGLPRVQALLLMGQYLQSTSDGNRCWTVFGLAIRLAQGMGLHLIEVNNHPRFTVLERELRKRCWCGCLVMDAVLSMTFGRPMMIAPEHYDNIDFPMDTDDNGNGAPGLLLFTHKLKLYQVLQRILRAFYQAKDQSKEQSTPHCGDMADLDQHLQAWRVQLPASLKMDEEPTQHRKGDRPRRILYARYLAVRIVLTRPSLAMVARAPSSNIANNPSHMPPLEQSFAKSAAETCISTAKHLLAHVNKYLVTVETTDRPAKAMQGAAWYNTHSVFSATLVLFSAQTIPSLRHLVIDGPHWADGMEVMRLLAKRFAPAQACLSIMESFHQHLARQDEMETQPRAEATTDLGNTATGFLPTTSLGPLPGDWLDFLGFDDAFGQDARW